MFTSCTTNYTKIDNRKPYNAKGFAYIFNEVDKEKNIIKGKMNNDLLEISHSQLKYGATIKLINPKTKDTIVLKNTKKIKYPEFYKIVISDAVANKLNIDRRVPLIEVLEIRKNKSFVAKKAKIFQEEKKIPANAPVLSVKIDNISKKKSLNKKERLNANINTVSGNVALGLVQKTNSITTTGGNTFHVATPPASNPTNIGNVQVFIDGLAQQPAISGNDKDYVYNNSTGLVSLTDATIPSGLIVQITALYPPS